MNPKTNNPRDRLFDLLEQIDEGQLPEPDRAELNELLREHPELVQELVAYREQCASLRIMHLRDRDLSSEPLRFPMIGDDEAASVFSRSRFLHFNFGGLTRFMASLLVLIAVTLGIGYTVFYSDLPQAPAATAPQPVVARLVATDQCRWASSRPGVEPGDELRQGTVLDLESGLAQIHYESGVSILFQGPGRLELAEPNAVCLHSGVVVSRVSPAAVGFTVDTPHSKVIDHGTEFAVGVDENRKTEVSVLEGKVELKERKGRRDAESRILTAGQALRVDSKGKIELFRTIDPKRLAKNITESEEVKRHHARVSIYRLRSASELKLKGTLVRAINVGGDEGIRVGDFFFEPDDPNVLDSPKKLSDGWGNLPWLGDAPEEKALCRVLHTIRHNLARKDRDFKNANLHRPVTARIPVTPGRYRVQLLISENHHVQSTKYETTDRSMNLDVEGVPCLRDLHVLAAQGIAGYPIPPNQVLLIDVELNVADGDLDIRLFSEKTDKKIDNNVILNGLIVERL